MPFRCLVVFLSICSLSACDSSGSAPGDSQGGPVATPEPPTEEVTEDPAVPPNDEIGSLEIVLPADDETLRAAEEAAVDNLNFATSETINGAAAGLAPDGLTDNTVAFRRLLAPGDRTIHLSAGEYLTNSLEIGPQTVLLLDPGVTIRDAGVPGLESAFITIRSNNVRISGLGARVSGFAHAGHVRHGISISSARGVTIDGLESVGHTGHGFLVEGSAEHPVEDVLLKGCRSEGNLGHGLIVTSGRQIRVVDCEFIIPENAALQSGIEIRLPNAQHVLDDLTILRSQTGGSGTAGIMIDLQALEPVSEPVTASIVEHLSVRDVEHLVVQTPNGSPANLRYSRAYESSPRQSWRVLRESGGGIVLSYYWPVVKDQPTLYELSMASPNVIDILASTGHGSAGVRSYWNKRGKILLNRVYPFRERRTEQQLYEYFAANIREAAGIAIDEVVAHRQEDALRQTLSRVLVRLRAEFPDKLIVVWDASRWDGGSEHLLRTLRDTADAIALQTYVSQTEARTIGFERFHRMLSEAESRAPGVREKVILAIGAHDAMRAADGQGFAEHLKNQVELIARSEELCGIAGIAVYAPVYLSLFEQQALDTAIREGMQSEASRPNCAPAPGR